MSMVQDLMELELRWNNGNKCTNPIIRKAVMEAREKICDIMNDTQIKAYNQLEDALGIDVKSERMLCDDIAYLQLFNSAWTCELIRSGYSIRVLDETIYTPEYRKKHEFFSMFKQDIHHLIVITIEMI